jgi:hypothetical protein
MTQPIDPEKMRYLEGTARDIGNLIGGAINRLSSPSGKKEYGFALILFSYAGSELTYISSSERSDMLKLLQEMITKLRSEEPGTSESRN